MQKDDIERWLRKYVAAWEAYDPESIAALFSEDVRYRYHPYDEPVRGRASLVASWLGEGETAGASTRDAPGTFDATYRTVAIDGEVVVATGATTYRPAPDADPDRVFDNCFVMRFDTAGQCCEFTEWYMERPNPSSGP
jgi:ketosteroid isomerase-like protein